MVRLAFLSAGSGSAKHERLLAKVSGPRCVFMPWKVAVAVQHAQTVPTPPPPPPPPPLHPPFKGLGVKSAGVHLLSVRWSRPLSASESQHVFDLADTSFIVVLL